jgi:uncharacterized protein (TIRG00374 family)
MAGKRWGLPRVTMQSGPPALRSGLSRRKMALLGVQFAIVAILCWVLFRSVRFDGVVRALKDCPWELWFGAFLLFVAERLVRPCRLAVLFRGMVPLREAIGAQSVSQVVNLLLPMRAGEMALVFLLRSATPVSASAALSIVVIDRVMDVVAILMIFAVALAVIPGIPPIVNGGAITLGLGCVLLIAAIALVLASRDRVLSATEKWLRGFAPARGAAWQARIEGIIGGFAVLQEPRRIAVAFAATAAVWALAIGGFALILKGIWPVAPISTAALAVCFGAIGLALLSVPAGLGILHAGYALAAIVFGAPQEVALAFAIVAHFLGLCATLLMGLSGLSLMRRAGSRLMHHIG